MTLRHTSRHALTDLQQAILNFVSSKGSATAEEVRVALLPKRRLKDASVRTLLRRLESRGYLSHRMEGKTFVYEAEVQPQSIAARAVQQIIDRFWSGSVEQFLLGMVDEKVLNMKEIRRLASKVKDKD